MKAHAIRFASAIVLAGATLTISTTDEPVIATAAPKEWDIGAYDRCMKNEMEMVDIVPDYPAYQAHQYCCDLSGGVWDPTGPGWGTCGAPPAVAADTPSTAPQEAVDPDVAGGTPPPTKPGPKPLTPRILGTPTTTPVPVG